MSELSPDEVCNGMKKSVVLSLCFISIQVEQQSFPFFGGAAKDHGQALPSSLIHCLDSMKVLCK